MGGKRWESKLRHQFLNSPLIHTTKELEEITIKSRYKSLPQGAYYLQFQQEEVGEEERERKELWVTRIEHQQMQKYKLWISPQLVIGITQFSSGFREEVSLEVGFPGIKISKKKWVQSWICNTKSPVTSHVSKQ